MANQPSAIDLRIRVVEALLEPVATLARHTGMSLDDVRNSLDRGYFQLLKKRGLSWEQMARRLGKSRRTVATLAKSAAENAPLPQSERLELRRRIVREAATTATTEAEFSVRVRAHPEFSAELESLLEDQLLEREGTSIRVRAALLDLLGGDFDQRFSSLRHLLEVVTQTIFQRFFVPSDDASMARVLTFSVASDELPALAKQAYEHLERLVIEADARAESKDDAIEASVVFCATTRPQRL